MYFIVDDSEVNEDESMETTTTANETPEVRTVVLQYNLPYLRYNLPTQFAFSHIIYLSIYHRR